MDDGIPIEFPELDPRVNTGADKARERYRTIQYDQIIDTLESIKTYTFIAAVILVAFYIAYVFGG